MTAPSWPPDETHPIEQWADHELIDQYRSLSAELAEDDTADPRSDDGAIAAIEEEINRRGLEVVAADVQPDPASAGREAEGPITFPP